MGSEWTTEVSKSLVHFSRAKPQGLISASGMALIWSNLESREDGRSPPQPISHGLATHHWVPTDPLGKAEPEWTMLWVGILHITYFISSHVDMVMWTFFKAVQGSIYGMSHVYVLKCIVWVKQPLWIFHSPFASASLQSSKWRRNGTWRSHKALVSQSKQMLAQFWCNTWSSQVHFLKQFHSCTHAGMSWEKWWTTVCSFSRA